MILSREKMARLRRAYRDFITVSTLAGEADCSLTDAAYYLQRKTLRLAAWALKLHGMTQKAIMEALSVSYFVLKSALDGKYDHF